MTVCARILSNAHYHGAQELNGTRSFAVRSGWKGGGRELSEGLERGSRLLALARYIFPTHSTSTHGYLCMQHKGNHLERYSASILGEATQAAFEQ